MIHLVFGAAAAGSLHHAFRRENHTIIGFPIDYSIGPLRNIHESSGSNHYFAWAQSSFHTTWDYFKGDQAVYRESLQQLLAIKNGEQVTIWTCENATEQIGLRISCYLLRDKDVELRFVNTYKAMHASMKGQDVRIDIRHTGECCAKELTYFYMHYTCPISEEMGSDYVQNGERLLSGKSMARSWQQGEIIDELETKDDSFILACATRMHHEMPHLEYIDAIRLVGDVLGNAEQSLSDIWIEYRVRSLIHSKQLAYEGDLQSMRMYKVKVV